MSNKVFGSQAGARVGFVYEEKGLLKVGGRITVEKSNFA